MNPANCTSNGWACQVTVPQGLTGQHGLSTARDRSKPTEVFTFCALDYAVFHGTKQVELSGVCRADGYTMAENPLGCSLYGVRFEFSQH